MSTVSRRKISCLAGSAFLAGGLGGMLAAPAVAQQIPVLDAVIGNNFGHLPMFVGPRNGFSGCQNFPSCGTTAAHDGACRL